MAALKELRVLGYFLCLFSSVAVMAEDLSQGEVLFRQAGGYGCVACHGMYAQGDGQVGGNIRTKTLADINRALREQPSMQGFASVLSGADRALLAEYLAELNRYELISWTLGVGEPFQQVKVTADAHYQLVITNKGFEPLRLQLTGISEPAQVNIAPYQTLAFAWQVKGSYLFLASDQSRLQLTLK